MKIFQSIEKLTLKMRIRCCSIEEIAFESLPRIPLFPQSASGNAVKTPSHRAGKAKDTDGDTPSRGWSAKPKPLPPPYAYLYIHMYFYAVENNSLGFAASAGQPPLPLQAMVSFPRR